MGERRGQVSSTAENHEKAMGVKWQWSLNGRFFFLGKCKCMVNWKDFPKKIVHCLGW